MNIAILYLVSIVTLFYFDLFKINQMYVVWRLISQFILRYFNF